MGRIGGGVVLNEVVCSGSRLSENRSFKDDSVEKSVDAGESPSVFTGTDLEEARNIVKERIRRRRR